jgi:hypothetical protein
MTDHTLLPALAEVTWFSSSARLVQGRPDTRYGWWNGPQGPCIVKALDRDLVAYADTLLAHERFMLSTMAALDSPVCQLVPHPRADWLVTRFAGLSLKRLKSPCLLRDGQAGLPLQPLEQVSAWVHLLQRMAPMAAQGILMVDLHEGNVTLPLLEERGLSGQLSLQRPCLIDHAHSLVSEAPLRRPLLIEPASPYIAPELRPALQEDHRRLRAQFNAHGYSRLPELRDEVCARIWAEYSEPQATLRLVQSGEICADRAMQYAAGHALAKGLSEVIASGAHPDIRDVVDQMLSSDPRRRHQDMAAAAHALTQCLPALPKVSEASLGKVTPSCVMAPAPVPAHGAAPGAGVFVREILTRQLGAEETSTVQFWMGPPRFMERFVGGATPWAYWALAAGATAGMLLGR